MKQTNEAKYAQMGIAALLPGMQFLLDKMQAELNAMRAQLAEWQSTGVATEVPAKKRGRPPGIKGKFGWEGMTAKERSAEMKRRQAVARAKREKKLHPRDPEHPEHAKWLAKMRRGSRRHWNSLTAAQKRERVTHAAAAHNLPKVRLAAQHVNGGAAA